MRTCRFLLLFLLARVLPVGAGAQDAPPPVASTDAGALVRHALQLYAAGTLSQRWTAHQPSLVNGGIDS